MKKEIGVDIFNLAAKSDLASLKAVVDELDINKLKTVPSDLSRLSNIVDNDLKKTVYDQLPSNVNAIDTSGFVLNTQYITEKSVLVD